MRRQAEQRVWDPLVRVSHWVMAAAFGIAWATAEGEEGIVQTLHVGAGYTILGLVALRLVWGVIGTRHARFASFVKGPRQVLAYLGRMARLDAPATVGHNPAAGAMIVALLVGLALTGATGLMLYGAHEQAGPLARAMAPFAGFDEALEEVHEFLAGFTAALVGLHVAGVLFSSLLHRENLIRAMITGRKPLRAHGAEAEAPAAARAA